MSDAPEPGKKQSRMAIVGFAIILIFGAGLILVLSHATPLLDQGTAAPALELNQLDGRGSQSLAALRGKVVLIDFWSTTCPPCIRQMRTLETIHARFRDQDLVILGVNTEGSPPPLIREFVRQRGEFNYPILVGGGPVSEAYRVTALPTLYLIDREGMIRWSRVGYTAAEELHDVIQTLL